MNSGELHSAQGLKDHDPESSAHGRAYRPALRQEEGLACPARLLGPASQRVSREFLINSNLVEAAGVEPTSEHDSHGVPSGLRRGVTFLRARRGNPLAAAECHHGRSQLRSHAHLLWPGQIAQRSLPFCLPLEQPANISHSETSPGNPSRRPPDRAGRQARRYRPGLRFPIPGAPGALPCPLPYRRSEQ